MSRLYRTLLSLFLIWHVAAGVIGVGRDRPWFDALAPLIRPYEQAIGIYQRWGMFAPHPPRKTIWPEAIGVMDSGATVALEIAWTDPDGDGVRRSYDYTTLLDRNLIGSDNRRLRGGYIRWLCRRAAAQGQPLQRVDLYAVHQRTLGPKAARQGEAWPEPTREAKGSAPCP